MGAMTASLLKQVMITLLRRSMNSANLWAGQLSVLSDPQIARVLAEMVSKPGVAHSVLSLSQAAGLSRSAFMARFTAVLGKPPMMALRDLRMRQAAILLNANSLSVDQIAHTVGYDSRSGFLRAFRKSMATTHQIIGRPSSPLRRRYLFRQEGAHQRGDPVDLLVEREMTGVQYMDLRIRHIRLKASRPRPRMMGRTGPRSRVAAACTGAARPAIWDRTRRWSDSHRKDRLDLALTGPRQQRVLIGPCVGIIALRMRTRPDVTLPGARQRGEPGNDLGLIGRAILPILAPDFPGRPQPLLIGDGILNDDCPHPLGMGERQAEPDRAA